MAKKNLKQIAEVLTGATAVESRENKFLPKDCPVQALGTKRGMYYYIDALGQFRELKDKEHARLILQGLLGQRTDFMTKCYSKNMDNR